MKIIMVDMDEVLADLDGGLSVFSKGECFPFTEREEFFDKWLPLYSMCEGFRTQSPLEKSSDLVEYLISGYNSKKFEICILTSVGKFYKPVSSIVRQKKQWLVDNYPELAEIPFCTTSSGRDKSVMAHPNAFLIDDHAENIRAFEERGGYGVVYSPQTFDFCISKIEEFLNLN